GKRRQGCGSNKIQQNKNFARLRGYLLIEASLNTFRSRWSPDQRALKTPTKPKIRCWLSKTSWAGL
ncbi:MAG: hypothetical protein ACKO1F_07610, partial [Flammeovirgaceae bacterium]